VLGLATGPRAFTKHLLGHCGGAAGVLDLVLALAGRGGSPRRALAWAADPSGAAAAVAVEEEA